MHGMNAMKAPSDWVQRWAHLITPGGSVLDLACGSGRHVRWLAARGHRVTAVDRDADALATLGDVAECVLADIENGPWPWQPPQQHAFDAVVVTNYLWRPLFATIRASLAAGGVLIFETFADGQQHIGRPARAEFLLQPGELLQAFAGLRVVAYEDGFIPLPVPGRCVQRLVGVQGRSAAQALAGAHR
jgi:SAM-dependent methyltransferase